MLLYFLIEALVLGEPLEYAKLYLDENMQMWVDAEYNLTII